MSLVEIARFTDVYEAELAAAFLNSRGVPVSVTERFQTTVDPLMQRALGVRLMTPSHAADQARDLLARAGPGNSPRRARTIFRMRTPPRGRSGRRWPWPCSAAAASGAPACRGA